MLSSPRHRTVTVVAVLALALGACSSDDAADDRSLEVEDSDADAPDAVADEDAGDDIGADADADDADDATDEDTAHEDTAQDDTQDATSGAAEPFASAETGWGGPGGGDVRLDLMEVTRRGTDFMEVRFRLTNLRTDRAIAPFSRLGDGQEVGPDGQTTSGLTVEDVDAGERLLVLRDSSGACVCSTGLSESIPVDVSRDYFARFPAPVSDRVDVAIPTFSTFNDVPVG